MGKKIGIFVGVLLLAGAISYFVIDANEKQFNKIQWHETPSTRYDMAKDIIDSNMLFGKTKAEIILLLGSTTKPSTLKGKDHLVYSLGKASSFFEVKEETLIIVFQDEKVINVIHSYQN
ncbi:MAG: hypothetical protein QNK89_08820 [Lacinutrix sp.]|uniref:hypothetical protein n=1 Tax=Lacinutrix sp. TaxID=1937692 RepID=UPI0030B00CB6